MSTESRLERLEQASGGGSPWRTLRVEYNAALPGDLDRLLEETERRARALGWSEETDAAMAVFWPRGGNGHYDAEASEACAVEVLIYRPGGAQ